MTNPNQQAAEQPSTPQQAAGIFTQIGELTAFQGKQYGDTHSFSDKQVEVPDSIATHFPKAEADSESIDTNMYVSQHFDRESGQPQRTGVVGIVTFTQSERHDADLIYATHVNYHVISDTGETFRLERHVTNTEHGPHKVAEHALGRAATREDIQRKLDETRELLAKVRESRKVEAELGLLTVSSREAEQILKVLSKYNEAE